MSAVAPAGGVPMAEALRRVRDLRRANPELSLNGACRALGLSASHIYDALARRKFRNVPPRVLLEVRYPRSGRLWTEDEIAEVLDRTRRGQAPIHMADDLGRPPAGIQQILVDLRLSGRLRVDDEPIAGLAQVWARIGCLRPGARTIDVSQRRILDRWIREGWLESHFDGRLWRTSADAIWDALENERTWPDWSPFRLSDPEWRAHFTARRGLADCLDRPAIAEQYGLGPKTIRTACERPNGPRLEPVHVYERRGYYRRRDVESYDWSACLVPKTRGLYYGRLLRPPRKRR